MFYGKSQNAIWLFFLVLGAATAAMMIVRELVGNGSWAGFAAWLLALVIGGRTGYLTWRRDWGSGNGASPPREDR